MKTLSFLFIVVIAGLLAGLFHGIINVAVVEPYLDRAIGIENQRMFDEGQTQNTPQFWQQFSDYRTWQKEGSVVSGGILGIATGSLFGLVFAYSRHMLPGQNNVKKALLLATIMWAALYFIPFLKYPANPPTVGDPHTIVLRATTYALFVALSGLGAFGFSRLYKKMQNKKFVAFLGYAVFIGAMFVIMPPNPDKISTPMELVNGFRAISAITMTAYWIVNALILGWLWNKVQPHVENQEIQK
ncbi:MAG: CbtA family protein [Thaumarchaeota archaeon]|nr:CbtA family protein [Nitrososphaerota archaeon]MDE1866691.1 CbtA family protein [Nitrososphaerota archaeon]